MSCRSPQTSVPQRPSEKARVALKHRPFSATGGRGKGWRVVLRHIGRRALGSEFARGNLRPRAARSKRKGGEGRGRAGGCSRDRRVHCQFQPAACHVDWAGGAACCVLWCERDVARCETRGGGCCAVSGKRFHGEFLARERGGYQCDWKGRS